MPSPSSVPMLEIVRGTHRPALRSGQQDGLGDELECGHLVQSVLPGPFVLLDKVSGLRCVNQHACTLAAFASAGDGTQGLVHARLTEFCAGDQKGRGELSGTISGVPSSSSVVWLQA